MISHILLYLIHANDLFFIFACTSFLPEDLFYPRRKIKAVNIYSVTTGSIILAIKRTSVNHDI